MYYHIIVFYTLYTARNSAASGGTPAPTAPADHVQLRPVRLYIHIHIHIYIFVYLYVSLSLYIYIYNNNDDNNNNYYSETRKWAVSRWVVSGDARFALRKKTSVR